MPRIRGKPSEMAGCDVEHCPLCGWMVQSGRNAGSIPILPAPVEGGGERGSRQ
jgi:hypothetical protein